MSAGRGFMGLYGMVRATVGRVDRKAESHLLTQGIYLLHKRRVHASFIAVSAHQFFFCEIFIHIHPLL
jgi:hypothetical protein